MFSQYESMKDLIGSFAETSNFIPDLMESERGTLRPYKNVDITHLCLFCNFWGLFVCLNHCGSVATVRGLGNSGFITAGSRR